MKVSLWNSKNLLSPEGREPPHIRAIKKAEFSSAFYVRPNGNLRRLFIAIGTASGCFGTSTVGLLSMRVTSSWSIR